MIAPFDPLPTILGECHGDVGDDQLLKVIFLEVVEALYRPAVSLTWLDPV
jgi:hypothetical protein